MGLDGYKMLGAGLLGFFFGIDMYDDKTLQDAKEWLGRWIIEHGGVAQVLNEFYKSLSDKDKESIFKTLEECEKIAIEKKV